MVENANREGGARRGGKGADAARAKPRGRKTTRKKAPQTAPANAQAAPRRASARRAADVGARGRDDNHEDDNGMRTAKTVDIPGREDRGVPGPATARGERDATAQTTSSSLSVSSSSSSSLSSVGSERTRRQVSMAPTGPQENPGASKGLLARASRRRHAPGHAVERASSELEEVQRSVARLRQQRLIVERIKQEAEAKDRRIDELEMLVQKLRSQHSQASLQALERERALRSKLLSVEQNISHKRDSDVTVALELKSLLQEAQHTENGLRCELARTQAELQERCAHGESEAKELRESNIRLLADKETLEDRIAQLQRDLEDKTRDLERANSRQSTATASAEKRCHDAERLLAARKAQLSEWKDKADALTLVNNKQREQLEVRTTALEEAERREHLLQGTIHELEENLDVLREQVEVSESGDLELRRQLKRANQRLEEADDVVEQLRSELAQVRMDSRITADHTKRQKSNFSEYEASLQRASAHRQRMEIQLKNLAAKVHELQTQLVEEMQTNASLTRQLEEERSSRTRVSRERLRILEEFYDEENKLKETLEHPFFDDARSRALRSERSRASSMSSAHRGEVFSSSLSGLAAATTQGNLSAEAAAAAAKSSSSTKMASSGARLLTSLAARAGGTGESSLGVSGVMLEAGDLDEYF